MTITYQRPASLDEPAIEELHDLEKELGVTLVAYEEPPIADLSEEQLKRVQALEESLGSTVIAFKQ